MFIKILYNQLSPCGHPVITDTPMIRTAAKSHAKLIYSCLSEINCRYYGHSLMRTPAQGPYSLRCKESLLISQSLRGRRVIVPWKSEANTYWRHLAQKNACKKLQKLLFSSDWPRKGRQIFVPITALDAKKLRTYLCYSIQKRLLFLLVLPRVTQNLSAAPWPAQSSKWLVNLTRSHSFHPLWNGSRSSEGRRKQENCWQHLNFFRLVG